jgi:Secretion system C-terminal sorting domain
VSSCAGNIVRIGAVPIQGLQGVTYNWTANPADPTMSCTTCAQPDVHPLVNTNYILTLTIPLQAGGTCSTTDTVLVKASAAPIPAAFGGPDKTVCTGSTISLGTPPQAGFNYNWLIAPYSYGFYLNNPYVANPSFTYYGSISSTTNPIIYKVRATKNGCVFEDTVKVFLTGASPGNDGCGPRVLGYPDPRPAIPKTFLWTVISGVGNILGANNTAQINVGAAVGGNVTYRLTVTMNGTICNDDVTVFETCGPTSPSGCQYPNIKVLSPNACANYSTNGGNVKLVASRTIPSTYSWSPAVGLSNTVGDTVSLTDNVQRTYTVTATSTIDPTNSCTRTIIVNEPVIIPVFTAQHLLTCPDAPVLIGQANVADYTYLWEDATGNSLNSYAISNPTATVNITSYFPVKVTSSSGCIVRDTASVTVIDFPQDIAGADVSLCDTNIAQIGFDPLPGYTYMWTGAGNFIPNNTVANPTVVVNATTTFNLIVTNTATGCTVTDTVIVTVSPPIPAFSFTNVIYCPSAGAITLPAGPAGMDSYNWTPSNLVLNPTSNGPIATTLAIPPSTPTTFKLYATNVDGCTKSASVLFTPNVTSPVAGNNRTICKGLTTQLGAAALPGTYNWSQSPSTGGSLNSTTISNPIFTANAKGTYTFTVSKLTAGCTSYATVVVTVSDVDLPSLSSPTVCQNTCIPIGFNSTTTGTQYFWNPTTALSDASISNPIACVTTNSLAYTLTAVGVNGCIAAQNMFVTVNPSPSHTVAVAPITACLGATGLSLNSVVLPAGSYNYLWSSNIGLSNIYAPNPAVSLTAAGIKNYDVVVTNNVTGCATTASTTVTANACTLPIKLESFTAAPQDKTVLLSWVVSEEINVLKYEIEFSTDGRNFWLIGSRAATNSTNYNLVHNSPVFGINYYRLKTIDKDGRISYSEIRTVNFRIAGNLTIYPNPANDILHITFAASSINKSATISVIAMDGKIMYQKNITKLSQTETLDVSKLANGCYIMRVLTNEEVINKSVVVYR